MAKYIFLAKNDVLDTIFYKIIIAKGSLIAGRYIDEVHPDFVVPYAKFIGEDSSFDAW